ncbi:FtsX-like permease family protein [Fusibacter sp. JL298sf-3]
MFKIAFSGMRGRKKDTFLMGSVILLSIIFVVTSTVLYSSSEKTRVEEKVQTYGLWQQAIVDNTSEISAIRDSFGKDVTIGQLKKIGDSSTTGEIAAIDTAYADMANFKIVEGRMPTADNEIILEYKQLSNFNREVSVGDEIPVVLTVTVSEMDEYDAYMHQKNTYIAHHFQEILDYSKDYPDSDLAHYIETFPNTYYNDILIPYYQRQAAETGEFLTNEYSLALKQEYVDRAFDSFVYFRYTGRNTRNTLDTLYMDDMRVEVKQSVMYSYFDPTTRNNFLDFTDSSNESTVDTALTLEAILDRGTVTNQQVVVTRPMVVTGFIDNYTENWTTDGYSMPGAYITENAGNQFQKAFYNNTFLDVSHIQLDRLFFLKGKDVFDTLSEVTYDRTFRNIGTYPVVKAESDRTITYGILALIFVATIASVFQINLTQMRRRTRKLTLLKSIGAVKKQVRGLLISELILYLMVSVPLGLLLGFGLSFAAIALLKQFTDVSLLFAVNGAMLAFGLLLAAFSVVIGSFFPMVKALRTPLTGAMNTPPKHKKIKHAKKCDGMPHRLTFKKISFAHARSDFKKNLMTLTLYTVAITTLLLTVGISYIAFQPYIDDVIVTDQPEYAIEIRHGLGSRDMESVKNELMTIGAVEDVQLYKYGLRGYLYHPDLKNHEPFTTMRLRVPQKSFVNISEDNAYLIEKALMVNSYGVSTDDRVFERLMANGARETLDVDAFEAGEEVILLLPNYDKNKFTYASKSRDNTSSAYAVEVGDTIDMTIPTENIAGTALTNDVAFNTLKVGAIVNDFDKVGVWPFNRTLEMPVLITSYRGIVQLYPGALSTVTIPADQLEALLNSFAPTRYGRTSINIYMAKGFDPLKSEAAIKKVADAYGVKIDKHYIDSRIRFNSSLKVVMIVLVLGIAVTLIALLILYNTALSKVENERTRIGTLQSLGVTGGQFKWLYRITGALFGCLSIGIAFLFNSLLLYGTYGAVTGLWLYPYKLVSIICGVFFAVSVLAYYLPIKRILRNPPIYNIQGNQK